MADVPADVPADVLADVLAISGKSLAKSPRIAI
jgi:hypothetical protein